MIAFLSSTTETAQNFEEGEEIEQLPPSTVLPAANDTDTILCDIPSSVLYSFRDGSWQQLGRGNLRISQMEDGRSRILFRTLGTGHLLLNSLLFDSMSISQPKSTQVIVGLITEEGLQSTLFKVILKCVHSFQGFR